MKEEFDLKVLYEEGQNIFAEVNKKLNVGDLFTVGHNTLAVVETVINKNMYKIRKLLWEV